jgi:hypothetical protein
LRLFATLLFASAALSQAAENVAGRWEGAAQIPGQELKLIVDVVFATSDSSLYHVADAATGKSVLKQQDKAFIFSPPVIAGDVVLMGVLNGTSQARDLKPASRSGISRRKPPGKTKAGA